MSTSTLVDMFAQHGERLRTRPHGSRPFLARIAWLALVGLVLVIVVLAIPARYAEMLEDPDDFGVALHQLGFSVQALHCMDHR